MWCYGSCFDIWYLCNISFRVKDRQLSSQICMEGAQKGINYTLMIYKYPSIRIPILLIRNITNHRNLFSRLLSMTPICCLEASSNSSQVLNSSNNTVQLNTSTATYNRRDSSNNNVNPSQPNQVKLYFGLIFNRSKFKKGSNKML